MLIVPLKRLDVRFVKSRNQEIEITVFFLEQFHFFEY